MDTTRPTRELTTAGGHAVVFRDYITGDENWQVRKLYSRALDEKDPEAAGKRDYDGDCLAYRLAVVSVDGAADEVDKRVLALPLPDYREVVAVVKEIVEGKKK
jgi:hypothetical protein